MTAILVLDGGLATELQQRGHDISGRLWSARLLLEDPAAIDAVQRDFLAAGAGVVTTATYQATHPGLAEIGLDPRQCDRLLRDSARRARNVADEWAGPTPLVVGSVGPYGAYLHDGSEYRGDYRLSVSELRRFHRRRLAVLAEECDVIAVETIPQLREVEALAAELAALSVPCWLSVSADGATLRSGEPAADAFAIAAEIPGLMATGANCIHPGDAEMLVALAVEVTGGPSVVYPNSGESYADEQWSGPASHSIQRTDVARWIDAGATIVGGCCRTTAADIEVIADAVRQRTTPPASR